MTVGSPREQSSALLNLFYPDHDASWLGLFPDAPAVLAFLLNGWHFTFPALWRWLRGLLILAQLVLLCWQSVVWPADNLLNDTGLALLVADIVVLIRLLTNQCLYARFFPKEE